MTVSVVLFVVSSIALLAALLFWLSGLDWTPNEVDFVRSYTLTVQRIRPNRDVIDVAKEGSKLYKKSG